MKNLLFMLPVLIFVSCNNVSQKGNAANGEQAAKIFDIDVKNMQFEELFTKIEPTEITDNVFKIVGEDFTVITAGNESYFNSMTAGWGGLGILFKPSTWCVLRANRYTLELIREEQSYTMCYFDDEYKDAVLYFGSKTGRDTDKMENNPLTGVSTPDGNIAYKEARLIIECKLMQITTVLPDDFYFQEGREFIEGGFEEAKDYHKLVFGEITNVWKSVN